MKISGNEKKTLPLAWEIKKNILLENCIKLSLSLSILISLWREEIQDIKLWVDQKSPDGSLSLSPKKCRLEKVC